jgi:Transposase, Mutator family
MSIAFSEGKLKAEERKAILQAIETQMQQVIIDGVTLVLQEFLEQEVTTKLGRAIRSPRRISSQPRAIDWQCANCGCQDANQFTRDGHYHRTLETGWGHLDRLRVPMVECQRCQHDVVAQFAILDKYKRFWLDAPQRAIFGSGLCQSLRYLSQQWAAALGASVGLRTINQLEVRLAQVHREPISDVPAVVQFDGIWLSMQTQQVNIQEDSRKRKRHQKRGKRMVVLVALGLWTDGSGKRHILDWEVADQEDQAAWERLVQRLWERGVRLETGLQAIVRDGTEGLEQALDYIYGSALVQQRCIFHKLRNVSDKCIGLDREGKKQFLEQAAWVYQARSASEAQARLVTFGERWRATQPQAVATFEREFEQTIRYYALEGMVREVVRTTSRLERTNRELRRKLRQVGCFSSPQGAEVAVYIQVTRLNAQWAQTSWWEVSRSLALDLLNSNP